jgi:hypothetical protein
MKKLDKLYAAALKAAEEAQAGKPPTITWSPERGRISTPPHATTKGDIDLIAEEIEVGKHLCETSTSSGTSVKAIYRKSGKLKGYAMGPVGAPEDGMIFKSAYEAAAELVRRAGGAHNVETFRKSR